MAVKIRKFYNISYTENVLSSYQNLPIEHRLGQVFLSDHGINTFQSPSVDESWKKIKG